jgi:hypothetical protein
MPHPLTSDDILAASAYLEAVWTQDADAIAALMRRGPGETPMPMVVAALGDQIIQGLMTQAVAGIHDGMTEAELEAATQKLAADPTARVSKLFSDTLAEFAQTADDGQCETIARSVIGYLMSISTDITEEHVLPLIGLLRDDALRNAGSS